MDKRLSEAFVVLRGFASLNRWTYSTTSKCVEGFEDYPFHTTIFRKDGNQLRVTHNLDGFAMAVWMDKEEREIIQADYNRSPTLAEVIRAMDIGQRGRRHIPRNSKGTKR